MGFAFNGLAERRITYPPYRHFHQPPAFSPVAGRCNQLVPRWSWTNGFADSLTRFQKTADSESHLAAEHTGHAIGEEVEADHQA